MMIRFHTYSSNLYAPLSHKGKYLYHEYAKVFSFLQSTFGDSAASVLAKPVFSEGSHEVEWYSLKSDLRPFEQCAEEVKRTAISQFDELRFRVFNYIERHRDSRDSQERAWSELLNAVFDRNHVALFASPNDVCMVWGWRFDQDLVYEKYRESQAAPPGLPPAPPADPPAPPLPPPPEPPIPPGHPGSGGGEGPLPPIRGGFIAFLRRIANAYWKLMVALFLIALAIWILLLLWDCFHARQKTFQEIQQVEKRIEAIHKKLNDCFPCR
jgi:hypothetical protein